MKPSNHPIDLRSDTVTRPTLAMREAMMSADLGDDVYEDDPSVNKLEAKVAKLLGFEAALFTPSGTMANQIAIHLHTQRGDTVLIEKDSHVYLYEAGASPAISGVQFDICPDFSILKQGELGPYIRKDDLHSSPTSLVVVENTHNRLGGRCLQVSQVDLLCQEARTHHCKLHHDGARLWNAAICLNVAPRELVRSFDSAAVCFSKGLGAPVGSALCGKSDFIRRARKIRKRWGGGMRQIGFLAAAAEFGLDHHYERLSDDHRRADFMRSKLSHLVGKNKGLVRILETERSTNMVYFEITKEKALTFSAEAKKEGLLINLLGNERVRAVLHLDIDDEKLDRAIGIIDRILLR